LDELSLISHNSFDAWVRSVDRYSGNDLLYLNLDSAIPGDCIIKKGEARSNPFKERTIFDRTNFILSGIRNENQAREDLSKAILEGSNDADEQIAELSPDETID
jgi:hypothetical protein